MSRTFTDDNLLVWEVYPSGGEYGFSESPYVVFNCLTNRLLRPRWVELEGDGADAERTVIKASPQELFALLRRAQEIP